MKRTSTALLIIFSIALLASTALAKTVYQDKTNFTFYEKGDKYEVTLNDNEKISELFINGEEISESDYHLYQDTVLNRYEKVKENLKDLDEDLKDFDKDMDELMENLSNINIEIDFDGEDLSKTINDALESVKDLDIDIKINGEDFKMNMENLKEELKNLENIKVHIDDENLKINLEDLDEKLSNISIDFEGLKNIKVELKESMKNMKEEMKDLDIEINNLGEYLKELKSELVKDGLIDNVDDSINMKYKNGKLYINDKLVPKDLREKYEKMKDDYL